MSASNAFETALLQHIFNNASIAGIGDATGLPGSTTAGSLYVALHTADPGEAGNQSTNEAAYTGYARVPVVRSGAGWTVAGGGFSNTAAIEFPTCTAGASTVTHFSIGVASAGASLLLLKGALTGSLAVSNGIAPTFNAGVLSGTLD